MTISSVGSGRSAAAAASSDTSTMPNPAMLIPRWPILGVIIGPTQPAIAAMT